MRHSLSLLPLVLMVATATADSPKNIVLILADDLGWADTTLYGKTSLYETPNIKRLAARGMTFSRAYASPICSPTRASIMTGQNPARHGMTAPAAHLPQERFEAVVGQNGPPNQKSTNVRSATRLDPELPLLVKVLKDAGYSTAHFGKWHLGREPHSPLERGFDVDLPHWWGPGPKSGYLAPWGYENPNFPEGEPGEHIEDRMAREAVAWLNNRDRSKPFFMNYWQFSVHAPFGAKPELIEKYRNKLGDTVAELSKPSVRKKLLSTHQPGTGLPQQSPTYAAMVHSLDDAVGSLLDALDAQGVADDTVIIFYSDNGGNIHCGLEEVDASGAKYITPVTSNHPLRGGKGGIHEGGVRVPAVVVWPGVTKPGSQSDVLIQATDLYPTILRMLEIEKPKGHVIDGVDFTTALHGQQMDRGPMFTHVPGHGKTPHWLPPSISVHHGDWKLIRTFHYGEDGKHDYHLYNLRDDIGESNNLAAVQPERVKQLDSLIEDYIAEANVVVPLPNPNFDRKKFEPSSIGVQPSGLKMPPGFQDNPKRKRVPKQGNPKRQRGTKATSQTSNSRAGACDRPNILFIVSDDHGWGDLPSNWDKTEVRLPTLESLAAKGVRFPNYHTVPLCGPSRACMFTGQYSTENGMWRGPGTQPLGSPGYRGIKRDVKMLSEHLAEAGYNTGAFGKWHMGALEGEVPNDRGFDQFRGFLAGAHPYWVTQKKSKLLHNRQPDRSSKGHTTELFTQWAEEFIRDSTAKDSPFFCYLAYNAVHGPLRVNKSKPASAPEEWVNKALDRGVSFLRSDYVAILEHMDHKIGRFVGLLDELEVSENTLIVFVSDNGGCTMEANAAGGRFPGNNGPLRGGKATTYQGGLNVPLLMNWKGRIPQGMVSDAQAMHCDIFATLLDAATVPVPETNGKNPVRGVSLMPHMLSAGKETIPERTMIFELWGNIGVRKGNYKLWSNVGREHSPDWDALVAELEGTDLVLFDLSKDVAEKNDLRTELPEVYTSLKTELIDHLAGVNTEYPDARSMQDQNTTRTKPQKAAAKVAPKRRSPDQFFKQRDANGDGAITLQEYIGNPKGRNVPALTKRFKRFDSNGDGKVQLDELKKREK